MLLVKILLAIMVTVLIPGCATTETLTLPAPPPVQY